MEESPEGYIFGVVGNMSFGSKREDDRVAVYGPLYVKACVKCIVYGLR